MEREEERQKVPVPVRRRECVREEGRSEDTRNSKNTSEVETPEAPRRWRIQPGPRRR